MTFPHHPKSAEIPEPPEPRAPMKVLSRVDIAFPAEVNPDPNDVPDEYWADKNSEGRGYWHENSKHPWVIFASTIFGGGKETQANMCLLPREGTDAAKVWEWADACLRSYKLKHEQKLAVVAWILDSYFWAYWFLGNLPTWVEEATDDPSADEKANE